MSQPVMLTNGTRKPRPVAERPFPTEPLYQLIGRPDEPAMNEPGNHVRPASDADRAEILGIQPRQLYRLRQSGLTIGEADRMAARLGMHPSAIWGQLWFDQANWPDDSDDT